MGGPYVSFWWKLCLRDALRKISKNVEMCYTHILKV